LGVHGEKIKSSTNCLHEKSTKIVSAKSGEILEFAINPRTPLTTTPVSDSMAANLKYDPDRPTFECAKILFCALWKKICTKALFFYFAKYARCRILSQFYSKMSRKILE
jgi:hypothetical protein